MIEIKKCSGCGSKRVRKVKNSIYQCEKCEAIFGFCSLGDSYDYVLPFMTKDVPAENQRYFDFTCISSRGVVRRHGWFDVTTKLITQLG